jgi:hypothetical protein
MKRIIAIALLACIFSATKAQAGAKWVYAFTVSKNADGSGYSEGVLGTVRNSNDNVSYLRCYYEGFSGNHYAYCYAYDGTNFLGCSTYDPVITDVVSKLQGDQYLYFAVDSQGSCTAVMIGSGSTWPQKGP